MCGPRWWGFFPDWPCLDLHQGMGCNVAGRRWNYASTKVEANETGCQASGLSWIGWQPSNLLDFDTEGSRWFYSFHFEAQSWRGRDLIWQEVYTFFYDIWVAGPSGSRLSTSGPAHSCAQAMQRMAVAHTKTMPSASTTRMMETIMRLHGGMNWRPHLIGRIHWLVYMNFATDFYWSDFSNLPQQKISHRKTLWSNGVLKESFPFLRLPQNLRGPVISSHLIRQEDTGLCEFRAGFGGVDESQEEWSASQCRLDPGLRVGTNPCQSWRDPSNMQHSS